jgi:hypothetical protein
VRNTRLEALYRYHATSQFIPLIKFLSA